jgi:hypothetical protein
LAQLVNNKPSSFFSTPQPYSSFLLPTGGVAFVDEGFAIVLTTERDAFLVKQSNPSHEKEQILLDTKNQEYQDSCSRS